MIIELATVLILLGSGAAILAGGGLRGWVLTPLGFIVGVALQITVGSVQAITPLPTAPVITFGLSAAVALIWLTWRRALGDLLLGAGTPVLVASAVTAGLAAAFRATELVNWHTDSFRYALTGSLLATDNYDAVIINLVGKRLLGVPLMHAPAHLGGEYYLRSVVPILAISTLLVLVWLCRIGLESRLGTRWATGVGILGALLLVSINRFIFHAFYINGHLLFATLLLLIVGASWLRLRGAPVPVEALNAMQWLAIPAVVVTRAEGGLMAALALLPFIVSRDVPVRTRRTSLLVLGMALLAWNGFVGSVHVAEEGHLAVSVVGMLGLGGVSLIGAAALGLLSIQRPLDRAPLAAETGLWVALVVFAVRDPGLLTTSVDATVSNLVLNQGAWGISLIVLLLLVTHVLVFSRDLDRLVIRFPVTTFLPFSFLLVYLRDSPYRVGHGDSLNRMVMQILPLMVLLIAASVDARPRWPGRWPGSRAGPAGGATSQRLEAPAAP